MRSTLEFAYRAGLVAAAFFLALIGIVILAQVLGRFFGLIIPSAEEIAAFSMAASIFLGLAATLRAEAHIRVELLLSKAPRPIRLALNLGCHVFAALMLSYLAWNTFLMTWDSFTVGDRSPGLWAIPLWIPQIGMAIGLMLMALACGEGAFDIVRHGSPRSDSAGVNAPVQSE